MNKILSVLFAIPVVFTTFTAPTVALAGENGTHSSERPGIWEMEHPPHRRWIYDHVDPEWNGDRVYQNDDRVYQQEYRHRRHYNNDGAWVPGAAALLGMGIILGSQPHYAPRPRYQYDHVQYCMSRYRSYRAWDNTYQPNYGPRRVCR